MHISYRYFKQRGKIIGKCAEVNAYCLAYVRYPGRLFLSTALCLVSLSVYAETVPDLADLPIESLLNMEVYSASKFPQKKSEAPTAVTVITAQDIKDYGYRTLAAIVQSVRGVYVDNDRNYSYAGTRGFNIPGDVNTRVLVLLDGYRLNDATYDQGPLGTEFPVDVDLIERVEYLPGAGSAIYGNNAFFGVINVITKSGKDFKGKGAEASVRVASYGTDQERLSFGKHFDNGLDVLMSATRYDSEGENRLFFPELDTPETHNGVTSYGEFDNAERLFGKISWRHFTLESAYSNRNKGLPTGNYNTVFNDPRNQNGDQHVFFNLSYDNLIADDLTLYARVYHGRYDYPGAWVYDDPPITDYRELGLGRWWGSEVRLVNTHFDNHKLMIGGEFQDNYHLWNEFVAVNPLNPVPADGFHQSTNRYGLYLQDEMTIRDDLILNAGLRYDSLSYATDTINPRLALIYKPWNNTVFKLLYGSSFRGPTANELYYTDPTTIANPNLSPEKIKTYEAIIEYQPDRTWRLTVVGFHYEVKNLIQIKETLSPIAGEESKNQFINLGINKAWGAEFEVEKLWDTGSRLRASYTWVNAYDSGNDQQLINSPGNLAKLNFSTPLFAHWLRTGIEAQYTDSRMGRDGVKTAGYPLFNLTLTSGEKLFDGRLKGLEVSGSVYNLLDRSYASVVGDEFVQHFIPQNGRNFRLVFSYRF